MRAARARPCVLAGRGRAQASLAGSRRPAGACEVVLGAAAEVAVVERIR
jgi:hypothetical protein